MHLSLPRRRPLVAALALTALTAGWLAGALPADAAQRLGGHPVSPTLRAALPATAGLGDLPHGTTRRAPAGTSSLRTADRSLGTSAPAPTRLTTATVSSFVVDFKNTPGNAWTQAAKNAFLAATDVWEHAVESRVPIRVEATARSLGAGVLGGAGPFDYLRNEGATVAPDSRTPTTAELADDVFEPVALFNARTGRDAIPPTGTAGTATYESNPDILAEFNPNLSGLYLGTDGMPGASQIDFRTIVLHEIGHGLGIAGSAEVADGAATIGYTSPNAGTGVRTGLSFDQFTYATTAAQAGTGGTRLLSLPDGSTALQQALTGDSLYWAGQTAISAAGGAKVRLYAPSQCGDNGPPRACATGETPFVEGTSYSHLDETTYDPGTPSGLMTPYLDNGESYSEPGQLAMALLSDMGYAMPALTGSRFTALDPVRVLDTREGVGAPDARVPAGGVVDLRVTGVHGVPAGATAVVLNVTGVAPSETTDVRVYPTPVTLSAPPEVSNLNLARGVTRANLVTVPVGNGGKVRLRNGAGTVDLLADLAGYYAPGAASSFTPVDPMRILDTREGIGTPSTTRVGPGGTVDLQVSGAGGIPAGATAVALTVTAVAASTATDVRVYPSVSDTATVPLVSNLNARPGPPVPNVVVVGLDPSGKVRLRNAAGEVHLLADVAGYYDASSTGSLFRAVSPRRILDTRIRLGTTSSTPTRIGAGQSVLLRVGGVPEVPLRAAAAVLNVTGVGASSSTDVRVYPGSATSTPVVSNLNLGTGQTAADLVVGKLGTGTSTGLVRLRNASGTVALLADVAGWFGPAA